MNDLFRKIDDHGTARVACKCGHEGFELPLVKFSNGTLHAKGTCPKCGKSGYFSQMDKTGLDTLKWKLKNVRTLILTLKGLDYHEGVAMLERLADELDRPEQ